MPSPLSSVYTTQKTSSNIQTFTKWTSVLKRFEYALQNGDITTVQWQRMIRGLGGLPMMTQIAQVNEIMNARPYVPDAQSWKATSDYWATPGEFMKFGGDCEDYSIAKYLALNMLGLLDSMLRITIVQDTQLNLPHALLLVASPLGTLVLDNQNPAVKKVDEVHRYQPLYSINRLGWWYHGKQANVA